MRMSCKTLPLIQDFYEARTTTINSLRNTEINVIEFVNWYNPYDK